MPRPLNLEVERYTIWERYARQFDDADLASRSNGGSEGRQKKLMERIWRKSLDLAVAMAEEIPETLWPINFFELDNNRTIMEGTRVRTSTVSAWFGKMAEWARSQWMAGTYRR